MSSPQYDLFSDRDRSIQERFEKFDAANPEIYRLFVRFAGELLNVGTPHYSADAILHRIRWHYAVNRNRQPGDFKINNDFSSRYARRLVSEDPRFAAFFEFRVLKSA